MTDSLPQAVSFPGMDPTESFQFYFRRHWSRMAQYVGFLALWMIAFSAMVYASGVTATEDESSRRVLIVVLCAFFLIPNFIFMLRVYKHFLYMVIVTDKKVHQFKRTLLAVDTHQSVDLEMLQDIDKIQRGIVQNMLGFGSLRLEAQTSRLVIHFVPHIDKMYNILVGLRESARRAIPAAQIPPEEQALPVQPS